MSEVLTNKVARLLRPEIMELAAYHVAPSAGMVKLDAMENPYGWPADMQQQWQQKLAGAALNRYPDPQADGLRQRLAVHMQVAPELGLMLGNGSDELIQIVAMALARPGAVVLAPEPSFVMYQMIARFADMDYVGVPLQQDWDLDLPAMLQAIAERQPALIFLAVPNNPTGTVFAQEKIQAVVEAAPGLVVLDEAYTAFTDADFMAWAQRYEHVLVMRTLSKVGLAGIRLGLLVGNPAWIDQFNKLRLPYNINVLTQLTAEFALDNYAVIEQQTTVLRRSRAELQAGLEHLPGVQVYPSETNFLVVRLGEGQAPAVFEALRGAGVLVKNLSQAHALLHDCLRITVGSPEENQQLLEALADALA